ncbi:MAG: NFACT family protein [Clostridiales bacterium]|nr:NFACT family protein [Clostridiales bacterium]
MPLDGITCKLLADELRKELQGTRIDKIFQPDKYTLFFHIRTSGSNKKLLISYDPTSQRVHFTDTSRENPMMPPSFCMLLRKYMQGAVILDITCPDYERIIEISFKTTDELHDVKNMRLIIELMGRYSNLILVNPQDRIIDSAVHVDFSISRVREVMPARIYEYPPSQDKINVEDALAKLDCGELPILQSESRRPVSKALLNSIKGMSPLTVNQVLSSAGIDDKMPLSALSENEIRSLSDELRNFCKSVTGRTYIPSVALSSKNEALDFSFLELKGYESVKTKKSISEAIDGYYISKLSNIDFENKRSSLLSIVNNALVHTTRKYDIHKEDYDEGLKAEEYKQKGDIILCYAYMIKEKDSSVTCKNIYDDLGRDIRIPLNPALNASDNAQEYFRRFRKAKRKLELSEEYIKEDKLAIDYLRSLKTAIYAASTTEDIEACEDEVKNEIIKDAPSKKKNDVNNGDPNKTVGRSKSGKASSRALRNAAKIAAAKKGNNKNKQKTECPSSYRRFFTSDGYECLCGRNNIQNDKLTFGVADKNDWWFHIKNLPGTHVILRSRPGEEFPSDTAVIEAAQAAAFYSRSTVIEEHQGAGNIKAEIDYCPVSHVKKIPKSKPGMVIYEQYYSIVVDAVEPGLNSYS